HAQLYPIREGQSEAMSADVRLGSFTSFPPSRRVRFAPRPDIGPMPAFMSTRPTARPKICLLKSRRSTHAGRRAVRDSTLVACYRSITHLAREGRMTVTIGRRELLAALSGAAAWPLAARAQQPERSRKVGLLHPGESTVVSARVVAIREGLNGPDNQRDTRVELVIRLADGDLSRLPA